MPAPSRRALELSEHFDLALNPVHRQGPAGERLARGVGSSIEFQDRRAYAPGDDVRHLDWRTYGRTGELQVKLYREEVLPRVDLLLDESRSMRVGSGKEQLAVDLAALIGVAARRAGFALRLLGLRATAEPLEFETFTRVGREFDADVPLEEALRAARPSLRPGSLRVLISDFLAPLDAPRLFARLASHASSVALVQVLAPEDLRPEAGVAARMIDAESGAARELVLDEGTVARYLERLRRLVDGLRDESARHGARFAGLDAGEGLDAVCRGALVDGGVLIPA